MEKILVQWSDGRSKGTTSLIKRSAVKKGTIAVGENVIVTWGKSKKTYNAQVLDVGVGVRSPPSPQQDTDDPLAFDLVAPATQAQAVDLPSQSQTMLHRQQEDEKLRACLDKLDDLSDAMSRIEARLLCRLQTLDEKVTALQKDVQERCILEPTVHPSSLLTNPAPEMITPGPTSRPDNAGAQMMSPTVLQDASSRANVISPVVGGYLKAGDIVNLVLQGCRSRRNFAARLATRMYTLRERAGSNCHGKQGKTALDGEKLKVIFATCMQHFPLERLETQLMADKEMRNAVDEVCRKTKTAGEDENSVTV